MKKNSPERANDAGDDMPLANDSELVQPLDAPNEANDDDGDDFDEDDEEEDDTEDDAFV